MESNNCDVVDPKKVNDEIVPALVSSGKLEEALDKQSLALEKAPEVLAQGDPDLLVLYLTKAHILRLLDRQKQSLAVLEEAISLSRLWHESGLMNETAGSHHVVLLKEKADIAEGQGFNNLEIEARLELTALCQAAYENGAAEAVLETWVDWLKRLSSALNREGYDEDAVAHLKQAAEIEWQNRLRPAKELMSDFISCAFLAKRVELHQEFSEAIGCAFEIANGLALSEKSVFSDLYKFIFDEANSLEGAYDAEKEAGELIEAETCDHEKPLTREKIGTLLKSADHSVFITSTFKDMQHERDMIQTDVIPIMQKKASVVGERFKSIDLRWGVNTAGLSEQEASRKISQVCFTEIAQCSHQICFIGDRYGWIPGKEAIEVDLDREAKKALSHIAHSNNLAMESLSITAMETLYGAYANELSSKKMVICFRLNIESDTELPPCYLSESEEEKVILAAIKRKLISDFPSQIIQYTAVMNDNTKRLESFKTLDGVPLWEEIVERLSSQCEQDWNNKKTLGLHHLKRLRALSFAKTRCDSFQGRSHYLLSLEKDIREFKAPVILVRGKTGSGKTSILSKLYFSFLEDGAFDCIGFFPDAETATCTLASMLESIHADLLCLSSMEHEAKTSFDKPGPESPSSIAELLSRYKAESKRQLLIFLDVADQSNISLAECLNSIPDALPNNVQYIVTSTPTDFFHGKTLPIAETYIPAMSQEMRKAHTYTLLEKYGKELSDEIVDRIARKSHGSTPAYIEMLVQRLLMLGSEHLSNVGKGNDLNFRLLRAVELSAPDEPTLGMQIIKDAKALLNDSFAKEFLDLLVLAERGLRASDLMAVFSSLGWEWDRLKLSRVKNYLQGVLGESADGLFFLSFKPPISAIEETLDNESGAARSLLYHLLGLPKNDPVKQQELPFIIRKLNEQRALLELMALSTAKKFSAQSLLRGIVAWSQKDGGQWTAELIENESFQPLSRSALSFCVWLVDQLDYASDQERRIIVTIGKSTFKALERARQAGADMAYLEGSIESARSSLARALLKENEEDAVALLEGDSTIVESIVESAVNEPGEAEKNCKMLSLLGDAYLKENDIHSAYCCCEGALSIASRSYASSVALLVSAYRDMGFCCLENNEPYEAITHLEAMLRLLDTASGTLNEHFAVFSRGYANQLLYRIYSALNDDPSAISYARSAYEAYSRAMSLQPKNLSVLHNKINCSLKIVELETNANEIRFWSHQAIEDAKAMWILNPTDEQASSTENAFCLVQKRARAEGIEDLYEETYDAHWDWVEQNRTPPPCEQNIFRFRDGTRTADGVFHYKREKE